MAELEKTGGTPKKKLASKVVSKVDTTPGDVVKWNSEGRKLLFDDESFLELPEEAYKVLSLENKNSYMIVKNHILGRDVVRDATPEAFDLPFNVRPDTPGRQLDVMGRRQDRDYHWSRPDKAQKHMNEGWVIDHDDSVKTNYDESCSYKTVGGQNSPELVLMSRPKDVGIQKRKERKALRDGQVAKTQGNFREAAEKLGVKPVVDSDNGVQ